MHDEVHACRFPQSVRSCNATPPAQACKPVVSCPPACTCVWLHEVVYTITCSLQSLLLLLSQSLQLIIATCPNTELISKTCYSSSCCRGLHAHGKQHMCAAIKCISLRPPFAVESSEVQWHESNVRVSQASLACRSRVNHALKVQQTAPDRIYC